MQAAAQAAELAQAVQPIVPAPGQAQGPRRPHRDGQAGEGKDEPAAAAGDAPAKAAPATGEAAAAALGALDAVAESPAFESVQGDLWRLYGDVATADTVLEVKAPGTEQVLFRVLAHRAVLVAQADYLRTLLCGGWADGATLRAWDGAGAAAPPAAAGPGSAPGAPVPTYTALSTTQKDGSEAQAITDILGHQVTPEEDAVLAGRRMAWVCLEADAAGDTALPLLLLLRAAYGGAQALNEGLLTTVRVLAEDAANAAGVGEEGGASVADALAGLAGQPPLHAATQLAVDALRVAHFLACPVAVRCLEGLLAGCVSRETAVPLLEFAEATESAWLRGAVRWYCLSHFEQLVYPLAPTDFSEVAAEVHGLKTAPMEGGWPVRATTFTFAWLPGPLPPPGAGNVWRAADLTVGKVFKTDDGSVVAWQPLHPTTQLPAQLDGTKEAEGGAAAGAAPGDASEESFVPPVVDLEGSTLLALLHDNDLQADESSVLQAALVWGKHRAMAAAAEKAAAEGKPLKRKGKKFYAKRLPSIFAEVAGEEDGLLDAVRLGYMTATAAVLQSAMDYAVVDEQSVLDAVDFANPDSVDGADLRNGVLQEAQQAYSAAADQLAAWAVTATASGAPSEELVRAAGTAPPGSNMPRAHRGILADLTLHLKRECITTG